jgi:ectoine hydroxylase-related dioxygenase (phytanoyl-CoA dioxygenase family)
MKFLTEAQFAFYQEHGYIIIEDFLKKPELDRLLQSLNSLVQTKSKGLDKDVGDFNLQKNVDAFNGDVIEPGMLRKIQSIIDHVPEFAELAQSDRLLNLVEDLIGPDIYYHSSKIMFKPARHGGSKPWHQDYAYWANTKPEQVTCWLALEDATVENGCMQLIPGSHKGGLVPHTENELQVDPKILPTEKIVVAPMKAGSLLCFHVLTFHYSGPNRSDKSRRAFIVDYDPNERPQQSEMGGDRLLRKGGKKAGTIQIATTAV